MTDAATTPPGPFDAGFYRGRRVLVTGHTGFKGAWLCEWLLGLGAEVTGCALEPDDHPNLFDVLGLRERMDHRELDLTDRGAVRDLIEEVRPEVVLHLAAQSLVLRSFDEPLGTLETNVMGTANLLAAIGAAGYTAEQPCAVVCVTSDKCYAAGATGRAHAEGDAMGGGDIYSASKGMVELLCDAWRQSFYSANSSTGDGPAPVRLATARAGNVLGGGDWARDRIVPDSVRALAQRRTIGVRRPDAVRPWQHVLEPLAGYLDLGQHLFTTPGAFESAWNFGPGPEGERTVASLCNHVISAWGGGGWQETNGAGQRRETEVLRLAIDKARTELGWQPTWNFETTLRRTVEWYRIGLAQRHDRGEMIALTRRQIAVFSAARSRQSIGPISATDDQLADTQAPALAGGS